MFRIVFPSAMTRQVSLSENIFFFIDFQCKSKLFPDSFIHDATSLAGSIVSQIPGVCRGK